jgi:preprotein translocase subunit SecE
MLRVRILPGLYFHVERPSGPQKDPPAAQGAAHMKKILQFFKDSYAELRKVVWPSKEDVIASTKVVIVSTIVMALVLGLIDFILVAGIDVIFR